MVLNLCNKYASLRSKLVCKINSFVIYYACQPQKTLSIPESLLSSPVFSSIYIFYIFSS